MRLTFKRHEHLKSKKTFAALFTSGRKIKRFPLLMVYTHSTDSSEPVQVGLSVSKRKFKHAVDRNRIKRQMHEAYRLNKSNLPLDGHKPIAIVFIYIHHKKLDFIQIKNAMQQCLAELRSSN